MATARVAHRDFELVTLHDLREEELEGEEDSPLRQDFGDFSSFEPLQTATGGGGGGVKNGSGYFGMEPFTDSSANRANNALGFLDLNSSKAPLKAGFDDFDGVSAGSLALSKDTLNLPFAEDSVKSVRSSPFSLKKSSSRGNISQSSAGRSSLSPQSPSMLAGSGNTGEWSPLFFSPLSLGLVVAWDYVCFFLSRGAVLVNNYSRDWTVLKMRSLLSFKV